MLTKWEYGIETEARRLAHVAHQIAVGFYRINNFIVLPYDSKYNVPNVVTFPDLPYSNIHRFWERMKHIEVKTLPTQVDPETLAEISNFLSKMNLPKPDYLRTEDTWANAEAEVLKCISGVVPNLAARVKNITIFPTVFGTNTSFNLLNEKEHDIYLYIRSGSDIYSITEAILTSLTRRDIYDKLSGVWSESEMISDWLVTQSSISEVLRKYQKVTSYKTTLNTLRVKQKANLINESRAFYKKLGIPFETNVFDLKDNEPIVAGNNLHNMTDREKEVLSLMIKKGSQLTTIDELAQILFKSEDDFSLQAIAKSIQRLRDKLEANGVSGSFIQAKRGEGYLLVN